MNTTALFKGKYSPVVQTENKSAESGLRRGSFDWSTPGAISFHLFDDHSFNEKASFVDGIVRIKVPGQGIEYKVAASGRRVLNARRSRVLAVSVAGVHILENGRLYLTGIAHGNTSATANLDKILSIIPSPHEYTMAKGLVVSFYEKALERLRYISEEMEDADDIVPAFVSDVKCQVQHGSSNEEHQKSTLNSELQEYEQELIDTRGLPESNVQPGPIMTNISIHSPDCQLLLTSTAVGTKIEIYRRKMINYAVLVWLSSGVELYALFTQMAYSSTPSKRSKVSQTTIVIMICYDAYLAMLHFILGGVLGGDAFLAFAGASFIKFLGFAVFGIRYLLDLCKSRGPGNSADSGIGIFYSRFCTYLIGGIFFFYQFGSSSPFIATVTGVVMSSLWVPQIFVFVTS
ncbi:hypothetical protein BDR26DRAFT_865635 [Obelidium mucronatum]|nr:hypothetical protein BDR26DRAFT_865635 [Obelidium mucronatum]